MNAGRPQTIYSGRSTNWPMIWLLTVVLVPFLAFARGPGETWTSAAILVPVLVVIAAAATTVLTVTSVRALAGPKGIAVHFGVFGWPRFRYPLDRIRRVEAIEIPSWQSVWGMYWSPRRGLMLTLRTGPALRLELTNGRKVTISTPQPAAAVRAIDDARDREPPP